jgi:hypothetical protein
LYPLTLREEPRISLNQLTAHCSACQPSQHLHFLLSAPTIVRNVHRNLLHLIHSHCTRPPQTLNDRLRADALLNGVTNFLQNFSRQNYNGGCSIADFRILGSGDISKDASGGVDDIKKLVKEGQNQYLSI